MKLSHIRDILAVAANGSLRSASRKLGITQPSMTRSIRDVENEFGVVLFTRHAHGVAPTDAGRLLIRRATAIESELRRISEELEQVKGNVIGRVSVATTISAGLALFSTVLPAFQRRFPHALLKVTESLFRPVEADIMSGEIDFFVGPLYDKPSITSLQVEQLFDNRRVIIARKGHPLLAATSLADLQRARWVRTSLSERPDEADLELLFERAGLQPPEIVVQTRSAMFTLLTVTNSDLLTIVPVQWLDFAVTGDSVETIHLDGMLPGAPICIVRRGDLPLTPLAESMCEMVRKAGFNYGRRMRGET